MELERVPNILFPGVGHRIAALLKGDPNASTWVKETGRIDHDVGTLARTAGLRGANGVIWDVGAYLGTHACAYAYIAKRVYAFEARRDAADCLRENLSHYSNAEVFEGVLGDGTPGTPEPTEEVNGGARRISVGGLAPSLRLDDETRIMPPTLVKMDVEGWEVKVLRGMARILVKHRPTLIIEIQKEALRAAGGSSIILALELQRHGYFTATFDGNVWDPMDDCPQRDIIAWPFDLGVPW